MSRSGVLIAMVLLASPLGAAAAENAWAAFVERPTPRSHERVVQAIAACGEDPSCRESVVPDPEVVARLVKLVAMGQPVAVKVAMEAYRLLGDPRREAIGQALGEYADVQPTRFLRTAKEHRLSAAELTAVVRTLPRGVDTDAARREAFERRRQALAAVADPEVASERVVALEGLPTAAQPARQGRAPPARGR